MPQLMLLAAIGAGCYAGYRLASKFLEATMAPGNADVDHTQHPRTAAASTRDLGDLEWDANAGVYRPKRA